MDALCEFWQHSYWCYEKQLVWKLAWNFQKYSKLRPLNKFLGLLLVNLLKRTLGFFHENNAQSFRIVFLKKTWVQFWNFNAVSKNTFEWRLRFLAMVMMCELYYHSARNIPEYGFPLTCTFPNKGCSYSGKYGSEKTSILTYFTQCYYLCVFNWHATKACSHAISVAIAYCHQSQY